MRNLGPSIQSLGPMDSLHCHRQLYDHYQVFEDWLKYKNVLPLNTSGLISEAQSSEKLVSYQLDKTEVQPQKGWSEQDPLEIIHNIRLCAENGIDQLFELGIEQSALVVGLNCLQTGLKRRTGVDASCCTTPAPDAYSLRGLITTVAYKLGLEALLVYALLGSIAVDDGGMKFLRDNLGLIKEVIQDTEHIASQVFFTGDVHLYQPNRFYLK